MAMVPVGVGGVLVGAVGALDPQRDASSAKPTAPAARSHHRECRAILPRHCVIPAVAQMRAQLLESTINDNGTMKVCPACDARFDSAWVCPRCGWQAQRHRTIQIVTSNGSVPGFASEFFDALPTLEEGHFWFTARNALIGWAISRYFPQARTFLEVGCGTGQVTGALKRTHSNLSFTASEAILEGLLIAERKAPGVELVQADARRLPWDEEFDIVGAFDVLEHIADHAGAVREMTRSIRPGGGVIVTVPQHRWLWSPLDEYSRHERRYTKGELVALLERSGLRVQRITSFVSLLLPMLLASRLSQRGRPVHPDSEFRLSSRVNGVGDMAMRIERALIRAGVSFPLGGSLLAVARR